MSPIDPGALARHYTRFDVTSRLLLTGHSHQAWPDCALEGQIEAWEDAARWLDRKWERAFAKADCVRRGFAGLLGDTDGEYTLAPNTHDLLVRFLSALPYRTRRKLVTTDSEFHTVSRQLARLSEEDVEVVYVPALPAATVGERLAAQVDTHTAAVIVSAVFFDSGQVAGGLEAVAEATERAGAELLVDVYHALDAIPWRLGEHGLQQAFIMGGGYKYCQLGEGNCFLRYPRDCGLRPVFTGWFADFAALADPGAAKVTYGAPGGRFAGATYDPVSHYRAARVFAFFEEHALTPERLRALNRTQLSQIYTAVDAVDAPEWLLWWDRRVPLERRGAFAVFHSPAAAHICTALGERGVYADHRGEKLRLGPAPYTTDRQIADAVAALAEVLRDLY